MIAKNALPSITRQLTIVRVHKSSSKFDSMCVTVPAIEASQGPYETLT